MSKTQGSCGTGHRENAREGSKVKRRKLTSSLATAGGLANVSVIATYQSGVFDPKDLDILECRHEVVKRVGQVHDGNTVHVVGLLMAQALALNSIFTKLAMQAAEIDERDPRRMETYMRLALKAQAQTRATLEAVVAVGNPPVLFAQQANVAFGPQQVINTAIPTPTEAPMSKPHFQQNQVLEATDGERLDTRAQGATSRADPHMAAVGEIDGAANG